MTAALRILAYGSAADHCDEYLKIGESTAIESLKRFCGAIIALYERQYMRSPNEEDITCLLRDGEDRGFPGSHNDLNILDHSPLFDNLVNGQLPPTNYEINGRQYTMGYYLTDGIYHKWATLIQTVPHPTNGKEDLFCRKQEARRKDVEHAFGVLQIRWGITQAPVRYWNKDDLSNIMKTCIILHNMIIEDKCGIDVEQWRPLPDENISPPEWAQNPSVVAAHITGRLRRIRNRGKNSMLQVDLMEHLWNRFGDEPM